ncbi:MAG: VTT domain-containing protein [Candidatus Micrarchaeia archaeon]
MEKKYVLQILFAILITIIVLLYGSRVEDYAAFGYFGVFIISLISSATIIIPAPGWIAVLELGKYLDPILLGIFAGIGSAIGELTGYFAGSGIVGILGKDKKIINEHKEIIRKYDISAIFFLSFIPNPAFDFAGIAAGAIKMDVKKFLIACAIGKSLRFFLIAYLGLYTLNLF